MVSISIIVCLEICLHHSLFGDLSDLLSVDSDNVVRIRKSLLQYTCFLLLIFTQDAGSRSIHQFALQTWPAEADEPDPVDSVITLISCLKRQQQQETLQSITVHCM